MNDSVPGGTLVTPVGPPTDEGPDAQEYLEILRRRWRWPVIAVAVAVAATAWIQLRRPELYTAEVLLQREAPRSPLDALNVGVPPGPPPEAIASQIEVLRSRSVLAAVVDSLGLRLRPEKRDAVRSRILAGVRVEPGAPPGRYLLGAEHGRAVLRDAAAGAVLARPGPDGWLEARGLRLLPAADAALDPPVPLAVVPQEAAIRALRRALTVRQVRGTPLVRVAHSSPDPVLAAATANAIAASYQAYAAARARAAATRRREFIAGQLAKIADSLAAAQQVLLDYQAQSRTLDPRIEGNALATALMDAQAEVRTLRFQEGLLRSLLLSLRSPSADAQAFQRVVALGGDLLPGGSDLYARLQELEAERTRLTAPRYGVTAADPRVEQLDSLIAATRADVRALADQALSVLRARLEAAEDRVRDLQAQVGELPVRATGFERLQQRVDAIQNIFNLLVEKYHEAQIAEAVEAGDVEVLDAAAVPGLPDPRRTGRRLLLAALLGLLAGGLGAYAREVLDFRIRRVEDAERASGLQLLVVVPRLAVARDGDGRPPPLTLGGDADEEPGGEAFRMLRAALRFAAETRPRVIAVVSAARGDGKTTVATNLAYALAQEGARVLLVDADLRRPAVHRTFGLERTPGLADVLVAEAAPADALRPAPGVPALQVLPAGTNAPRPAELLGGRSFAAFLQSARERFDAVIVDTPPVLAAADATLVASLADGAVFVARANQTDRRALGRAAEQLRQARAPLLGLVVNELERRGPNAYYLYYYDYYGDRDRRDGKRRRGARRRGASQGRLRRWLGSLSKAES